MMGKGGYDRYIGSSSGDRIIDVHGPTWARLGAGKDVIWLDKRYRHNVDCGGGHDETFYVFRGTRSCERVLVTKRR